MSGHERAQDGTAYWTVSLYVGVDALLAQFPDYDEVLQHGPAAAQLRHLPSVALRNTVDPLFNDIADREFLGRPRDFLFAAGLGMADPASGEAWSLAAAKRALLRERQLTITLPGEFGWTTEGVSFRCHFGADEERRLQLRRFWFVHSDGALSYHLSFSHHFRGRDEECVRSYYFLSLLQKLVAAKEFLLAEALQEQLAQDPTRRWTPLPATDGSVSGPLGIDPLDRMRVRDAGEADGALFWHYVRDLFVADARLLLGQVLACPQADAAAASGLATLLKPKDVIEVPGLQMPRCRYLFHIDDRRLFNRLLPLHPLSGDPVPRKRMVREGCYKPYRAAIRRLMRGGGGVPAETVHLGTPAGTRPPPHFDWAELDLGGPYDEAIASGFFIGAVGKPIDNHADFQRGVWAGSVRQCRDDETGEPCEPFVLDIPAYERGRGDCLDYMFLAGFNQNIIDWLNQDTSEILDSLDPIYPTQELQEGERFFVRYANHRGMITYVNGSRSLEVGNDYLGTCPYAFLIHVVAMHNEFLTKDHEQRSVTAIAGIAAAVDVLEGEPGPHPDNHPEGWRDAAQVESDINRLKRDSYERYERHRYLNIFRYDTEALVFARLADLRGTEWRGVAIDKALATLEEYAEDVARRQKDEDRAAREHHERRVKGLIGTLGIVSGGSFLFNVAGFLRGREAGAGPGAEGWPAYIIGNLAWLLSLIGLCVLVLLAQRHRDAICRGLRDLFGSAGKSEQQRRAGPGRGQGEGGRGGD